MNFEEEKIIFQLAVIKILKKLLIIKISNFPSHH